MTPAGPRSATAARARGEEAVRPRCLLACLSGVCATSLECEVAVWGSHSGQYPCMHAGKCALAIEIVVADDDKRRASVTSDRLSHDWRLQLPPPSLRTHTLQEADTGGL